MKQNLNEFKRLQELAGIPEAEGAGELSPELQLAKWVLEQLLGSDPGRIKTIEPGDEPLSYKFTSNTTFEPERNRIRLAKLIPGEKPKLAGKPEVIGHI